MAERERLICASLDVAEGERGVRFSLNRGGHELPAFVVRWKGRAVAYLNQCRHQASELDWNPGDFFDDAKLYLVCATHGALYRPDDGRCVAGPCRGAALVPVALTERDGNLYCSEE